MRPRIVWRRGSLFLVSKKATLLRGASILLTQDDSVADVPSSLACCLKHCPPIEGLFFHAMPSSTSILLVDTLFRILPSLHIDRVLPTLSSDLESE